MPRPDQKTIATIGLTLGLATLALIAVLSVRSTARGVEATAWLEQAHPVGSAVSAALLLLAVVALRRQSAHRLRAEEEIRKHAKEIEDLHHLAPCFALSQDLLCVVAADGSFLRVNPAWERVLGYSTGELLGQPFIDLVHPDDRQTTLAVFEEQIAEGACVIDFENRYRTKSGSYVALLWRSAPGQSEGCVYASARDISERKANEDALRAATRAAEAASRELESFSYSVSHDLRAPLRAIDGFSHALLEDYDQSLDAEAKRHLDRVCRATRRMSELIEDLLKLSRISRYQLKRERIDLSSLAARVIATLRRTEPDRDVEVTIATGLVAWGDLQLVRIGLENLLGNAWKYTRKREQARIELDRAIVDGEPAWLVRDNGAGFDMIHADRLFGAFRRLHRSEEFEGTGIGLAATERLIRLHGGRIWAEAAVDEGATFYFTLGPDMEGR